MGRLQVRLAALVALALLPALIMEITFFVGLRHARQNDLEQDVMRQAELVHETIATIIEGARQLTYAVAQANTVKNLDPDCRERLLAIKQGLPNYRFLSVLDKDGRLVCTTWPVTVLSGWEKPPYLVQAIKDGAFTVGDFRRGMVSGEPFLPLVHPVRDDAEHIVGIVVAGLDLAWLGNRLAQLNRPEYSTIVIGDRQGVVLARYPDSAQRTGKQFLPENMWLVEAMTPGTRIVAAFDGRDRISGYIPPSASHTGLLVSVAVYPPTVLTPVWQLAALGRGGDRRRADLVGKPCMVRRPTSRAPPPGHRRLHSVRTRIPPRR